MYTRPGFVVHDRGPCTIVKKTCINPKIFVWEHACGMFVLNLNIFDVGMLLEVVWNFVLLLCALFFARQLCVLWPRLWCAKENLHKCKNSLLGACVRCIFVES